MNIFDLFASLKLDTTDYDRGIDDAKRKGDDFADKTENETSPKAVNAWMAIVAAVVAVGKAIVNLATASMDYADTVGDMAAKFGVTTDSISEMQYIADQSSTSIEGMTSAMSMLLNRAKEDGEVFQQLGVSVRDANGNFKSMDELFYDTVGALNEVEDANERNALMLETFGRSAFNVGEVVRKSSEELAQMRQEAHDLGVVMSEETINYASDFNDVLAVLKLRGQSALAGLISGAPDAEEKLQDFFDGIIDMLDDYIPAFVNFVVRLVIQVALAIVRLAPSLVVEIVDAIIDTLLSVNWLEVGVNIAISIVEGIVNVLGSALGFLGIKVPRLDLGTANFDFTPPNLTDAGYEISESKKHEVTVKVEATGDTPVSQETARKTAEELAPYLDEILGGR